MVWRLIRWQSGWAVLIAIPKTSQQIRFTQTLKGIKVNSDFCLLPMEQKGSLWSPIAQLRVRFQANLPLPTNWRICGLPQTICLQGLKWLLLPVSFRS